RRVEVLLLADERRHGRALDHCFHFALDRQQRAADDLKRDGIAHPCCSLCLILRHLPQPAPTKPCASSSARDTGKTLPQNAGTDEGELSGASCRRGGGGACEGWTSPGVSASPPARPPTS